MLATGGTGADSRLVWFVRSKGVGDNNVLAIPGFQDPFSCFSHLFAVPFFLVWGIWIVRKGRGNSLRVASLCLMVVATITLLSVSGVYHVLPPGTARNVMRQLDMSAVFVLIAATITPIHAILFRGWSRWVPLIGAWTVAVTGVILLNVFPRTLGSETAIVIYLMMGWGGGMSCVILGRRYGLDFVRPLIAGGVAYSIGAVVLGMGTPTLIPGVVSAHEIWHVAVLVGLFLHWCFVQQFARGQPDATRPGA